MNKICFNGLNNPAPPFFKLPFWEYLQVCGDHWDALMFLFNYCLFLVLPRMCLTTKTILEYIGATRLEMARPTIHCGQSAHDAC